MQLVYTWRTVLAYFRRAGTAAPMAATIANCWTVAVTGLRCRTCCVTLSACTVSCVSERPGPR